MGTSFNPLAWMTMGMASTPSEETDTHDVEIENPDLDAEE
ncbi:MAG: hypothetical protein AMXMBFR84_25950 [Candidatus Hydrogenedentota bacterium]